MRELHKVFAIFEKLLNSLKYKVDKDINDTLYKNKTFLSSKWSAIEYNILKWSQRYTYYIFLTVILAVLFVINLLLWQQELSLLFAPYFPYWNMLIDWQGAFLSAQLTIVGVVYPLVIGLIGLLFQNKTAKKTLFPLYQMYSGFMYAGLSGLFLAIFVVIGYFISGSMEESTYLAICITTALWLIFNTLLTIWFFTATFLMLDEVRRDRLLIRFTIHELCENDIRKRISDLLLQNSLQHNLLANPDPSVLKVSSYKLSDNKYKNIDKNIKTKKEVIVSNVYFAIINTLIRFQVYQLKFLRFLKRNSTYQSLVSLKVFRWLNIDIKTKPEIIVQAIRTRERLVVVRYKDFNIGWLSKLFFKISFKIGKAQESSDKSLSSMLTGFTGTVNDAIREKDIPEFKYALDNIVKWHTEIASALSFINDNGEEDNWLLLPTANFFSRTYYDQFLSEYYRISKAAVELIPENIEFFDEAIYLHKRLFARRDDLVSSEGLSLIQGSYHTWYLLIEWRSYSSTSPDIRIANKYEDVLYDFVGSWETWLDYIKQKYSPSTNLSSLLPLLLTHLEHTAQTSITALRFNNIEAAGWGVDMLNNWIEKLLAGEDDNGLAEFTWKSELITHNIMLYEPNSRSWLEVLNGTEYNFKAAYIISLNNAAFDLRVLTACYILLKPNIRDNKTLIDYVRALLNGVPIHPTGAFLGRRKSITNAGELLGTYIRHRDYPNDGSQSYSTWLAKVLDSFNRVNEKRRVSGRIYSGWGRNDPKSMNPAYVEIAVSLSKSEWKLSSRWLDLIFSDMFRHMDRESIIRDLNDWLTTSDNIEDPSLVSKNEYDNNLPFFKKSIEWIIENINKRQDEIISNSDIDEERLTDFGVSCSTFIYKLDNFNIFPLSLFRKVSQEGEQKSENLKTLNISNYKKVYISKGVEANRAINEDEWLKEASQKTVKENILKALFGYEVTDSKIYSDVESFVIELHEMIRGLDNPVLFTADDNLFRILFEARYNQELAEQLGVTFYDGYGGSYICHLGRVIVYKINLPRIDYSLLTSEDVFETIEFSEISPKQIFKLEYIEGENDNKNIGTLSLQYWMDVELKVGYPCIKIQINIQPNDD